MSEKCPRCEGKGVIFLMSEGHEVECPTCEGRCETGRCANCGEDELEGGRCKYCGEEE